jgi:hypothetical protein
VEAWGLRGNGRRFLPLGENFFSSCDLMI